MLQLRNEVLYKLLQSILQFRVQIKQQQFSKFNSLIKQIAINHRNSFQRSTSKMLTSLILQERYNVRQMIQQAKINANKTIKITLQFYLKDRKLQNNFRTQVWHIQSTVKNNQEQAQNFDMLLNVFQELIFFLNKRPMFDFYQKNKQLRKKYQVFHNIMLQQKQQKSLLKIAKVQKQIRQSKNIKLNINCYYTSDLDSLHTSQKFLIEQQKPRKQSVNIQNNENSTKVSVYSFYDPVLNFTFISSDSEDLKSKGNFKHHQIQDQNSDDQFEILIMSQDQKFIDQNERAFLLIDQIEQNYLNTDIYMN